MLVKFYRYRVTFLFHAKPCRDVPWNVPTDQYNVIIKKRIVIAKVFEGVGYSF
jgi:hypothetical protein